MKTSKKDRFSRLSPAAVYDRQLSAETLRVLAAIGVHADKNGECWPSAGNLALRLGCKERVVQYHVKALKRGGYLETFWRKLSNGMSVRWFRLRYPAWEDPAETQPDCGSETQPDCVSPEPEKRNLDADETQFGDERTATPLHPTNSPSEQPISEQPNREHATDESLSGEDSFGGVRGGRPRLIGDQPKAEPSRKKTRGTRLPSEAILPDEWRATAQERRPDLDPEQVFEKFKRYFTGPDAARPAKKDWNRAWLNWIDGERNGQSGRNPNQGLGAAAFAGAAAALGRSGKR